MSSNNTRIHLKSCHRVNSSLNDTNSSVKVHNSSLDVMNSSFNGSIANMCAKSEIFTKYQLILRGGKSDVTGEVTHFFVKQAVATDDNNGYHNLTTKYSAAKLSRHSLAIFMSKICLTTNQQVTTGMNNTVLNSKRYTYGIGHGDVSYDGKSEPNKIPLWGNKLRRLNTIVVLPLTPFFKQHHQTTTKYSGAHHG